MTVEIISASINHGIVTITALNVDEVRLQWLERRRDDQDIQELEFAFDTSDQKQFLALRRWIRKQEAAKGSPTWGAALRAIVGITTDSYGIGTYRKLRGFE